MDVIFKTRLINSTVGVLEFVAWNQLGIEHGFLGKLPEELSIKNIMEASSYLTVKQVHGKEYFDARSDEGLNNLIEANKSGTLPEADAIIFNKVNQAQQIGKLFYICTADCVPLVMKVQNTFALIHAGWRGLAQGIVSVVVEALMASTMEDSQLEVLIGPCAGSEVYEVGEEVLMEIGSEAKFQPKLDKKFLLDLGGTAANQVKRLCSGSLIYQTNVCTISSKQYNSYRREDKLAGRNISFIYT